ncbi:MAG: HAD family phosphatase, partial [Sphingobacteriaceae bacterium]
MENTPVKTAFLFDLNGTMIDDMEFHGNAWFDILNNDLGAGLSQEQVKKEMYGKNPELLERVFGKNKFSAEEVEMYSMRKELDYQAKYKPHLKLLPGLDDFLEKANQQEIKMAIASAAIPFNIDFVVDNLGLRRYIQA